ncbi:alanine racemase [Paenibacillus agaridevorans]|uniref:alanine racemase n=1 Tax=Paenibacillus agaridevorans TaxID=171404 RepID=UPI001BE47575|nr:alanine racemase [Paenibacillus agaridevorans]
MSDRHRHTWVEISLDGIRHNIVQFQHRKKKECLLMAVVKANGYGHGAVEVARVALDAGADYLGVAFADEAFELRSAGITAPILILGYTPPEFVPAVVLQEVTMTVFTDDVLQAASAAALQFHKKARIHLKIDTGMSRIGVQPSDDWRELVKAAFFFPQIELEGVFTHFAEANGSGSAYTRHQFSTFQRVLSEVEEEGITIPIKHCCNTAGTLQFPNMHMDMVRVGVGLYGVNPCDSGIADEVNLVETMAVKTRIAAVKWIASGQAVGYGRQYCATQARKVATLPIGYADGIPRKLSNTGFVVINGELAPIIGVLCMDQMMVDVTVIEAVEPGTAVTLFGGHIRSPQSQHVSVEDVAAWSKTISYEVMCGIGKRVPRVYMKYES